MKLSNTIISFVITCLTINLLVVPVASADQLLKEDFQQEYFDKEVDFFDYARAWAVLKGLPKPPEYWHANVYMTYVNYSGFQLLYTGLSNISLANTLYLTIPMQTILMHYKTQTSNEDTLVASSFLMIMGFNDTDDSLPDSHMGSPDKNDDLWASFSLGLNLQEIFPEVDFPAFNSSSEIIPLDPPDNLESDGSKTWTWGMKYTNLTALWVSTNITDEAKTEVNRPFGLATYDELTFKYTLEVSPDGTATLQKDYILGEMHDLWVFGGWFIVPIYNHYNSTGCYRYGAEVPDAGNVYEFLEKHEVSMSIVEYQKVITLTKDTITTSEDGEDVTENEVDVSDSSIATSCEDGELICENNFNTKTEYQLVNPNTEDASTYERKVRTAQVNGYARNRNLFKFQTSFQRYIPLVLIGMYPEMYQRAKETITNVEVADCLYIISYPTYKGYRIVHDPVLTAYFAPTQQVAQNLGGLVLLAFAAISIIVVIALLRRRRTLIPVSSV